MLADRPVPARQVVQGRAQGAGGLRPAHRVQPGVVEAFSAAHVTPSPLRRDGLVLQDAGGGHPQRSEDLLGQERLVAAPAHRPDDRAQQQIAGVVVRVALPRLELERLLADHRQHLGHRRIGPQGALHHLRIVVPDARRVVEQMAHADGAPARRPIRQIALDRRVDVDQPALGQHHGRHGGELLGQRSDAENAVRLKRSLPFEVGQPIGPAVDERAVPEHRHGRAWPAGPNLPGEQGVDIGFQAHQNVPVMIR